MNSRLPLDQQPLFWHIVFILLCGGSLALTLYAAQRPLTAMTGTAMITGIALFLILLYGYFLSPKRIKLNTFFVHNEGLPAMKIAVASDIHIGPYKGKAFVERAVKTILSASPDLILLPGDFLFDHRFDATELEPLRHLHAPLGVFAVMGNHDTGRYRRRSGHLRITQDKTAELTTMLTRFGIRVLANEHVTIDAAGKPLTVAGAPDVDAADYDLGRALEGIPDHHSVILLTHNPDVILEERSRRADLIVCGHTHGGQIRLPFFGSVAPIPDRVGRRYDRGIFSVGDTTILAITSGLGESGAQARLFCPPEVMVISLQRR